MVNGDRPYTMYRGPDDFLELSSIMAPKLDSEYRKMLNTPASSVPSHSPRSFEFLDLVTVSQQVDYAKTRSNPFGNRYVYIEETNRLKYAQNSHIAVSRLPAEMVFLYVVDSGLRDGDTRFATGTFGLVQVCKHRRVAVGFPRLWSWWIAGAAKAWPLFTTP